MQAAMADESTQPVPCELAVSMRLPLYIYKEWSAYSTSSGSPSVCPPLTSTPLTDRCSDSHSASSSGVPSCFEASDSASGRFGVISVHSGISSSRTACRASGGVSGRPDVDSMMGSSTVNDGLYCPMALATACTVAASGSIPILTACGIRSSITAASCSYTRSAPTATLRFTPWLFCTVRAVGTACP